MKPYNESDIDNLFGEASGSDSVADKIDAMEKEADRIVKSIEDIKEEAKSLLMPDLVKKHNLNKSQVTFLKKWLAGKF